MVGIGGSPEKLEMLQKEYGVDAVINYKEHTTLESMSAVLFLFVFFLWNPRNTLGNENSLSKRH